MANFLRPISHYILTRWAAVVESSRGTEKSHFNISRLTPYRSSRRVVNTLAGNRRERGGFVARSSKRRVDAFSYPLLSDKEGGRGKGNRRCKRA